MQRFYGHGKLLLTGEYTVLDGALALAVPTRFGQSMRVETVPDDALHWKSLDVNGNTWFEGTFLPDSDFKVARFFGEEPTAQRLTQLLAEATKLRPASSELLSGKMITTHLEFDRSWGLGSSSTLLYCLAQWLDVDAHELLKATFGGSGYDLACAATSTSLTYQLVNQQPVVTPLNWLPEWVSQTYFVYRNQKQNSRAGIKTYRERKSNLAGIEAISKTTALLTKTRLLAEAQNLLWQHEKLTSELVGLPTVQEELFLDFPGVVKSLGAWGGDFCWVLTELDEVRTRQYFAQRGLKTVLSWAEMVLA